MGKSADSKTSQIPVNLTRPIQFLKIPYCHIKINKKKKNNQLISFCVVVSASVKNFLKCPQFLYTNNPYFLINNVVELINNEELMKINNFGVSLRLKSILIILLGGFFKNFIPKLPIFPGIFLIQ